MHIVLKNFWLRAWVVLIGLVCSSACLALQDEVVDFESDRWTLVNAEVVEHMGRKALIGTATLKDVEFENGVIEVDIYVDGRRDNRSYPGLIFRMQSMENCERFYIRPHRTWLYPDALQYTPVINGIAGWQLYNGEGYTASVTLSRDEWVHVKMEIAGRQARIFVENMDDPALVVTDLKHGVSKGTIGIFSARDRMACFSNFSYRIDDGLEFDAAPDVETPPGMVTEWELSQAFPFSQIDLEKHPDQQELPEQQWQRATTEPSGLLDIALYAATTGREPACIYARKILHMEEDRMKRFEFGYSDLVSIFLNGQIVFLGNSAYRSRDPSFLGIVGRFDQVYLPLKKGENELLFLVTETFGGWGLICRDADAVFEHPSMRKAWEIKEGLRMPESAIYDKSRDVVYITNYDLYGVPGQQFISKVSTDGEVIELKWVEGLVRPLGMVITGDKLYVVERRNVAEIELPSGKILQRLPIPQAGFPNDMAMDKAGNLYVSDSRKGVIYKYSDGRFEEWLTGLNGSNGLVVRDDRLIVGVSGDHAYKAVDLTSQEIVTIARFATGNMDGVRFEDGGNYLFSHYEGRIYRVKASGQITKLLDLPEERCADFEYIPGKKLFIIPTLEVGKVLAYTIE